MFVVYQMETQTLIWIHDRQQLVMVASVCVHM